MSSFYVPSESLLQSRAFRRLLVFSLAAHILVYAALLFRSSGHAQLISPSPVMVQLVAAPKAPAPKPAPPPPKPAAKPLPKPPEPAPAPPPKPVVKEIVIPKEAKPLPEKPKPAPPPPAETKPQPPPPSPEELLAKITQKVEAEEAAKAPQNPAPAAEAQSAVEGAPGAFDPLLSPWVARVRAVVRQNWSGAQVCKGNPQFDVDVDAGGQLTHIQLAESSGDRYCDATAERALEKSNPLPPPPRPLSFTLELHPKDAQE